MTKIEITPGVCFNIYRKIVTARPNWFWVALHINPSNYEAFQRWVLNYCSEVYEASGLFVFVRTSDKVSEAHAAFIGKVEAAPIKELAEKLFARGIVRIEVPLINVRGVTIRNVLRQCGFQLEGLLRNKFQCKDHSTGETIYLDVEMWSIIPMKEKTDGN